MMLVEEGIEDYDIDYVSNPNEHKHTHKRKLSSFMVAFNVNSFICNISNMGLPFALALGGWTVVFSLIFISFLTGYTCELLAHCLYDRLLTRAERRGITRKEAWKKIKIRHDTMVSIARQACPKFGKPVVIFIVLVELIGTGIMYLLLLGSSVFVLANYFELPYATLQLCTAITGFLSLSIMLIPSMAVISWFSMVAIIGLLVSLAAVSCGCIYHLMYYPVHWEFLLYPDLNMVPIAFSIIIFTFSVHVILPTIEGSMRSPHNFALVVRITFAITTLVKLLFGLLCSMTYGTETSESISDNIVAQPAIIIVTHLSVAISVFFSLPLIFDAIGHYCDMLLAYRDGGILTRDRRWSSLYPLWLVGTRGGVLGISILIGILVPHFALVMAIIGSISGSFVCFILPSIFNYLIFRDELNLRQKIVRLSITVFGFITCILCASCSSARLYYLTVSAS